MLFVLYICFEKNLQETSHLVFIKILVIDIWFLLLCWPRCSEARTVLFHVHGGLSKRCHANYVVYSKSKIMMDYELRVLVESYWKGFLPVMTFLFSSVFIFQSTCFRVTSFKGLLFIVRTFFFFLRQREECKITVDARASSEAIQARLWLLCRAKSIKPRRWDRKVHPLISSYPQSSFWRGRKYLGSPYKCLLVS